MTQDPAPLTAKDVPDEIVRSIRIAASIERVWALVAEPGWYINDGEYRRHVITVDGDTAHVVDPVHGEFVIGTEVLEEPHRAVFRWLGGEVGPLEDHPTTRIEFTLEPDGDGVLLTVRETGFARLGADAAERRRAYEGNVEGWVQELGVARALLEVGAS